MDKKDIEIAELKKALELVNNRLIELEDDFETAVKALQNLAGYGMYHKDLNEIEKRYFEKRYSRK